MNKEELLTEYEKTFGEKGQDVFFSPGRINVILVNDNLGF